MLLSLRPFFGVIAWSTVIAITCYPLHQRLVRRNGRVALSAAITSTLMVLAVLVPLFATAAEILNLLRDTQSTSLIDRCVESKVATRLKPCSIEPYDINGDVPRAPQSDVAIRYAHGSSTQSGAGVRYVLWRDGR